MTKERKEGEEKGRGKKRQQTQYVAEQMTRFLIVYLARKKNERDLFDRLTKLKSSFFSLSLSALQCKSISM